jgi:sulfate adenylyltransferase
MALVNPHGKDKKLMPLLLEGAALKAELEKAKGLTQVKVASREVGDLIMMGIGGFTPLTGFMGHDDWKGVCAEYKMADGTFWPIPITCSTTEGQADSIKDGEEVALVSEETGEIMATMKVTEKYKIDKEYECSQVYTTTDLEHPGVAMVMGQEDVNLAGPVKVLSQGEFPTEYKSIYLTPSESRKLFESKGWNTVAAFQTRNPMHRSHEYLAKIAIELLDGCFIHMLLGKLKPGDIPADTREQAIDALMEHSHLLVGRDHAGVGDYYGPFDAHKIFDEIPEDALETKPMKIDWTFYCTKCDGMASMKTCPHGKEDRMILSGTKLRKMLSEGDEVPDHFSRPEVLKILRKYYEGLTDKVEIKEHKYSQG